ncbi:MAG: hypothetical protein HON53_25160 [Planctomycetaceae bacterium]|jgi:hypothetical protein|nr:hypothetical protein [Planctomycetaceae bacterium]MBT6155158.1 hypothetical protein [Planctomycetaceae bacterium]MBT6483326.1 hypothetical protein [Planctomycetaceae bacterium]MBT6493879.1 hypothetical protein [Planctomycetaceae bacterium]
MSRTVDDFWAAYHRASACAGRSVQIFRTLETNGDLLRLLDEIAVDELQQASEAIDAIRSYLVPAIPDVATFGPAMAASWHHAVYNCLGDLLRDIMNIVGAPPEVNWYAGTMSEEQRDQELLKVGDRLVPIREFVTKQYSGVESELKRARCMLYKEMSIAWQAYNWECAMGINAEPPNVGGGTAVMTSHGPDFRSVIWNSKSFSFTRLQSRAVALLWEAWDNDTPEVGEDHIVGSLQIEDQALRDVFSNHKAWGTMIVAGETEGSYRLVSSA